MSSIIDRRRITSSRSGWASMSISNWRRTLARSRCRFVNCGMACQFNSSETAALDQLDEYVQDALDLIEFANGPVTSPWGKLRAQMGHPEPFHLTMIGRGQRAVGTALRGALQGVRGSAEGEASGDQAGGGGGTAAGGRAVRQHVGDLAEAEGGHRG